MRSLFRIKYQPKPVQSSLHSTNQLVTGFFPRPLVTINLLSYQKRTFAGGSGHNHGTTPHGNEHKHEHKHGEHSKHAHASDHGHDHDHSHDHDHDHGHGHGHGHHENQDGDGPDYTPKLWTKSGAKAEAAAAAEAEGHGHGHGAAHADTHGHDHGHGHEKEGANVNVWDPTYVPTQESDFDRDPMDVRLREPLPKEAFIPKEIVLERIIKLCQSMERAKTEGKSITEDTHLANDLGLDSLDQVEFGLALEDEFDIEIPDEEAEQIVTIGDAVELIADHPQAR